jgi:hypothetical protein
MLRIVLQESDMTDDERAVLLSKLNERLEQVKTLTKKEALNNLLREGFIKDRDGLLIWGQEPKWTCPDKVESDLGFM